MRSGSPAPGPPRPSPAGLSNLLLLRAGVERNPGPPRWPCTVCTRSAEFGSLECSSCLRWTHFKCCGTGPSDYHRQTFKCPPCSSASSASSLRRPRSKPFRSRPTDIVILQLNINGLSRKTTELFDFTTNNDIKIIALQETKLSPNSRIPNFPNFTLLRKDRNCHGGGLALFIHHSINFAHVNLTPLSEATTEQQAVDLIFDNGTIRLTNVYIPPINSCPPGHSASIAHLLLPDADSIIVGDFNAHDPLWHSSLSDARGANIASEIEAAEYGTLNDESPTRSPTVGQTTSPDITIVSPSLLTSTCWTTATALSSDHLPILTTLQTSDSLDDRLPKRTFKNYNRADWDGYKLESDNLLSAIDPRLFDNPDKGEKLSLIHI